MYKKWMDVLSKIKLFSNIDEEELNSVLTCLRPDISTFKKNEYITIENDECSGPGIIVEGQVTVSKENAAGDRIIISKLDKGNIFGEVFAFSDKKRWRATVIASDDCTVLFLPSYKILGNCSRICVGHKALIQNMLKIISQKALTLNRKVEYLTKKSIRKKVSSYLLEQSKQTGKLSFLVPLKRQELAEFLNISRPSLSREIGKMKDEGLIDYYRSSFKILNLNKLKENI